MNQLGDGSMNAFASLRLLKAGAFVDRQLPPDVIASIENLIDAFACANAEARIGFVREVDFTFSFAFFLYARSTAVDAVRQERPDLLKRGLLSLAIENCTFDPRDSLLGIVRIYNSALKFPQINADKLLADIEQVSCKPFSTTLSEFRSRPKELKSLTSFGLRESMPPSPFDYEAAKGPSG